MEDATGLTTEPISSEQYKPNQHGIVNGFGGGAVKRKMEESKSLGTWNTLRWNQNKKKKRRNIIWHGMSQNKLLGYNKTLSFNRSGLKIKSIQIMVRKD